MSLLKIKTQHALTGSTVAIYMVMEALILNLKLLRLRYDTRTDVEIIKRTNKPEFYSTAYQRESETPTY